jgi:hypothetical protein
MTFREKLLSSSDPTVKNPDIHSWYLLWLVWCGWYVRANMRISGFLTIGPEEGRSFSWNVVFLVFYLRWWQWKKSSKQCVKKVIYSHCQEQWSWSWKWVASNMSHETETERYFGYLKTVPLSSNICLSLLNNVWHYVFQSLSNTINTLLSP